MSPSSLRLRIVFRSMLPVAGGLLLATLARSNCEAAEKTYVLASDGYGIDDCLATHSACGKMVADAWCSAHGSSKAVAFGSADDVTASVGARANEPADAVVVTCGD